ncbi:MAG: phosphatidylcholine/phosphatidylserine synthase [Rhizobiaceae bacterium]
MFGFSKNALWAFSIHILTASGAFFAFLSLVAAAEFRFENSFLWLGVALAVDGIDGPLARKLEVKKWWPHWSGDTLDNVIDYVTFVMIPAFILYQSGLLGKYSSFLAAAIIVITSAIYYADTRMKTSDHGFMGFPVCWNMVVFALYIISPNQVFSIAVVLIAAVLTFVPIIFVHPVRVKVLRKTTLAVFALWGVCGVLALAADIDSVSWLQAIAKTLGAGPWVVWIIVATSIYLFCVGGILQLMGRIK